MSGLIFDVFPADDPNGAALGELTEAYDKSFQGVHQAIGSGQFTVNRSSAQAAWAVADNLVRVRRATGGPFDYDDARYIGAFWIETGTRVLLSEDEEGGRDLTMGGRTPEAALRWAILYPDAFDSRNDPFTTHTRDDGNWHILDRTAGEVLTIFLRDLDDRTPDPLPFISRDFTITHDSTGGAWSDTDTDWAIPVGTNGLDLLGTCVSGGLFYRIGADFEWHAYEDEPGANLSASIVLTEAIEIANAADQDIAARETVGRVVVQGTKDSGKLKYREVINGTVESGLPGRREGFVEYRRTPTNGKLDAAGNKYIRKSKRRHDGPLQLAYVEGTGQEAFVDFVPGDIIKVNIPGAFNNSSLRVYAITLEEDEAGNVTPVIDFEQSPFDPNSGDAEFDNGEGGSNCGDCPPLPPHVPGTTPGEGYTDPAFMALLRVIDQGGVSGTFTWEDTGDTPAGGWYPEPSAGPLAAGQGASPYSTIVASAAIRVRIEAAINMTEAVIGSQSATMSILINGSLIAQDIRSTAVPGAHSWSEAFYIDIPEIALAAGDVVSVGFTQTQDLFWTNTTNLTFLRVGRGHHVWDSGLVIWDGPTDPTVPVPNSPLDGQQHVEQITGDGSTTAFQTNYPYAPGSLAVYVDGLLTPVTETDPTTGTFTFASAPATGAVIIARYQNAGTTGTGATNPVPTASTPISGSSLTIKDEGGALATAASSIDFVGAGVVASGTGAAKTITVSEPAAAAVAADLAALSASAARPWVGVLVNNPSIVTTDGLAVWVPWTTVDGGPVLAQVPLP